MRKTASRKHYVPNGIWDDNFLEMQPLGEGLRLAAIVSAFARGFPWDRGEGALEEGVVDDVAFVIFAFDDPVARIGFALSGVGVDKGEVETLCGVDEKGSAGAKRVHEALLPALFCRRNLFQQFVCKKGVIVFVNFRKGQ